MNQTVDVLPHIREMKDTWRRQDFVFTRQQREEYQLLITARRERVRFFYENGLVHKPSTTKTP